MPNRKAYGTLRVVSDADLAYLAGIIDGEGCIRANRANGRNVSLVVKVAMKDKPAVQMLKDVFGGGLHERPRPARVSHYFSLWSWVAVSARAAFVLDTLLPYLRVKRREAELGLLLQTGVKDTGAPKGSNHGRLPLSKEELDRRNAIANEMSSIKRMQNLGEPHWVS